ncbi:MAG: hypothetical protein QOI11_774, partial [Candidatus Eremiobacteraeota bacterium]|nr:hypothetical protein [Candidatus Eremiobacteraeota bacterium]
MSVFFRSSRAAVAGALLATVPLAAPAAPAPAAPAAAVLPIRWTVTPAQIAASCKAGSARIVRRVDALARLPRAKRTFATVVLPLESAAADYNDDLVAQGFLYNV